MRHWINCRHEGQEIHDIAFGALEICVNLDHRGGCGCDPITGDGAGIFIQTPHKFFTKYLSDKLNIDLPQEGDYGVGFFFLSNNSSTTIKRLLRLKKFLEELNLSLIA